MLQSEIHHLNWWTQKSAFKCNTCSGTELLYLSCMRPLTALLNPSPTQRIETKRHRVCLELPDNVIPKEEDEEEEEDEEDQYGKRPRLSLLPPRYASPDCKRHKGEGQCHRCTNLVSSSPTMLEQNRGRDSPVQSSPRLCSAHRRTLLIFKKIDSKI